MATIGLNSNLAAMRANRLLTASSDLLAQTFERLSSGQRINRASDDAAGLSVADKLRAEARLFNQAKRNLSDGLSTAAIMNGAIEQQTTILNRLAELAEQSANGTFSNKQRQTLSREYTQLLKEFGRIGDSTSFNGVNLLRAQHSDGFQSLNIQAGINGSVSSRLTLNGIETGTLSGTINISEILADFDNSGFIDGQDLFDFLDVTDGKSLDEILTHFGGNALSATVRDSQGKERNIAILITGSFDFGTSPPFCFNVLSEEDDGNWRLRNLNGQPGYAGVGNSYNIDPTTGKIVGNTSLSGSIDFGGGVTGSINFDLSGLVFQEGAETTAIDFTDVKVATQARKALTVVRNRLQELSSFRGQIGAFESRIQSAIDLTTVSAETRQAAESRIRDVDVASESAQLTRLSILQQAGAAVLAQARQQPQLALLLLNR